MQNIKLNIFKYLQFNQARNLIIKLIKHDLLH